MVERKPDYVRDGGSIHPEDEHHYSKNSAPEALSPEEKFDSEWKPGKHVRFGGSLEEMNRIVDLDENDVVKEEDEPKAT